MAMIKMKKTNKLFFCLISILILSAVLQPAMVTATSNSSSGTSTFAQVSLIDTGKNDSYSRLALVSQANSLPEVWVEGSIPAEFTYTTAQNTTIGSSITCSDTRAYPYNLGNIGSLSPTGLTDPWDTVSWLHVDNIEEMADDEAQFNISVSKTVLGTLAVGSENLYNIDNPNLQWVELHLSIKSAGVHILYFDAGALAAGFVVNSEGNVIPLQSGSLPLITPGGERIRDYFLFTTDLTGDFIFNLVGAKNQISFNLQKISSTNTIKFGNQYSYKDAEFTEVGPDDIQGDQSGAFTHVYELEVEAGQYLHHNFDLLWGSAASPNIQLAIPALNGYTYTSIDVTGDDDFTFIPYDGTAYLIVIHENYFEWNAAGPIRNLLYYMTTFREISEFESYTLGDEKVIQVSSTPGRTFLKIEVNQSKLVHFSAEVVDGNPTFGLLGGNPATTFAYNDPVGGAQFVQPLATFNSHSIFMFHPGTYYTYVEHPGNSLNSVFMILKSQDFAVSPAVEHTSKTVVAPDQNLADLSEVEFELLDLEEDDAVELEPHMFPISYSDFAYNLRYNITFQRSDNTNIVGKDFRFHIFTGLVQQSRYNNATFTSLVPIVDQGLIELDALDNQIGSIVETATMGDFPWLMGEMDAYLFIWPFDLEWYNDTEYVPYEGSDLTFKVGTSDQNEQYQHVTFSDVSLVNTQVNDIDYATIDLNLRGTLDTSAYAGVLVHVNHTRMYDWWQIVSSFNNTGLAEGTLLYDNIWLDNYGPNTANNASKFSAINSTFECGIAPQSFTYLFEANPLVGDIVDYDINIACYNITLFHTPTIHYESSQSIGQFIANLPSWAPYAGIGGGVAIIGLIVILVIKKKRNPI